MDLGGYRARPRSDRVGQEHLVGDGCDGKIFGRC
jgi:hypothetical protein